MSVRNDRPLPPWCGDSKTIQRFLVMAGEYRSITKALRIAEINRNQWDAVRHLAKHSVHADDRMVAEELVRLVELAVGAGKRNESTPMYGKGEGPKAIQMMRRLAAGAAHAKLDDELD